MSGNTTQTGLHTGRGQLAEAGHNLLPIPFFVIGIFVGTFLYHCGPRYAFLLICGLVATLLAAALAAACLDRLTGWFSITTLSLAMGLMNTAVTRVGGQSVSLGYVTGDLNHLADHLALAVKRVPVPQAQGPWDTHGRRAAWLVGIWTAFLIGRRWQVPQRLPLPVGPCCPRSSCCCRWLRWIAPTGASTGMPRAGSGLCH